MVVLAYVYTQGATLQSVRLRLAVPLSWLVWYAIFVCGIAEKLISTLKDFICIKQIIFNK